MVSAFVFDCNWKFFFIPWSQYASFDLQRYKLLQWLSFITVFINLSVSKLLLSGYETFITKLFMIRVVNETVGVYTFLLYYFCVCTR